MFLAVIILSLLILIYFLVLVARPTEGASVAQDLFDGSMRRAKAHTRLAWPKIPSAPSALPLLGAPQAPGNKPNPKGVKSFGDGPLRPEDISSCRDILGQVHAAASTAGRSTTQQGEEQCYYNCCYWFISRLLVLMHQRNLKCKRVLLILHFLTHRIHVSSRLKTLCIVFSFLALFFQFLHCPF